MAGLLYGWGDNDRLSLGTGVAGAVLVPTQIGSETWSLIAPGDIATLGIKEDGTLWAWGGNDYGILGLGDTTDRAVPQQVGSDKWLRVSLGASVCVGIKEDGTLWGWGRNNAGQFGAFASGVQVSPVQLGFDTWVDVAASGDHFLAIRSDGEMFAGGSNIYKQLGIGYSPYTYASFPTVVAGGYQWRKVTTSPFNSAAITTDDDLYVWGEGQNYATGVYYPTDYDAPNKIISPVLSWKDVMLGKEYVFALEDDGSLWVWGDNYNRVLGTGDGTDVRVPTYIALGFASERISPGYYASFLVNAAGEMFAGGRKAYNGLGLEDAVTPYLTEVPGLVVSDIFGGPYNAFALSGTAGAPNFWTNFSGQTEIL